MMLFETSKYDQSDLMGGSGALNESNETFADYSSCSNQPSPFLAASEATITTLGLIFNGIAIFVIIQLKDYKKIVSHWYVLHLSIADVLLLLHLVFQTSEHIQGQWIYSDWFCSVNQGLFMMSYYAGIFFLTVMSFDRYVAIVHPVSAQWRRIRTRYNANIVTLFVWLLSFLLSLPLWVFSKVNCACGYDFSDSKANSENDTEEFIYAYGDTDIADLQDYYLEDLDQPDANCRHRESRSFFIWILSNFIITFVIPIIMMAVCYSLILWRVLHPAISSTHTNIRRRRRSSESSSRKESSLKSSFRSSSSSSSSSHRLSRKGKVTFVVASLVACFLICWCPFHLMHLIRITTGLPLQYGESCQLVNDISHLLAYSNSMLNPILYTYLGSDFRRRLRSATKSFRPRRVSSGFSKSNRTARVSAPTYGRSVGNGTQHKAMEGLSYPMNTIHSMVSKHYSQDHNERPQFLSTRKRECSSRCDDALQFSDVSESRLIH